MRIRRPDDQAQMQVLEAVMVGVLVFTMLAVTSLFQLPTSPSTFQQSELQRLGDDTLQALSAKPPSLGSDCNESPCPFRSDLERMLSLAIRFEGPTLSASGEPADTLPLTDYLNQSLPSGTRYIISYSNGVNDTKVYPVNLVPPSLDVSVGHVLLNPNWTRYASSVSSSVIMGLNELTGLQGSLITKIQDPLNRDRDEWGHAHLSTFADTRVPVSALYGTYKVTPTAGAATYFTIVPPGVFGAGAHILPGDRDNTTAILSKGPFYTYAKYNDTNGDNKLDPGEGFYLDLTTSGTVSAGDLRLSDVANCVGAATCRAGTSVKTGDADQAAGRVLKVFPVGSEPRLRSLRGNNDGKLDEGEWVYLDLDGSGTVSLGDRRFSRVGTFPMGSIVAGTDADAAGAPALDTVAVFTSVSVVWGDTDHDATLDAGEPVYLDLAGNGQAAGLESLDLHLNPKGNPTTHYVYDVKLVVWYGV